MKLLALGRGAPVHLDRLVEGLWPQQMPARLSDEVGVLVSRLRSVLGAQRLRRTEAGWSLALDWLDIVELGARSQQARERLRAGRPGPARAAAAAVAR